MSEPPDDVPGATGERPVAASRRAPAPPAWMRLAVLALGLALFLPGLGARDLWNPDEPRYALVAREMVERGDYLVPHLNGAVYRQKPPLLFWAIAASGGLLGGVGPTAARLPSALAAAGTLLLVFELGRMLFGLRTGWLAAAVLGTAARLLWQGRVGQIDMLLVFLVTLAVYFWVRAHFEGEERLAPLFFAAAGLATLAKGPVGLLPPLLSIVVYLLIRGEREALARLRVGRGLLLWAAVVLAWLVPAAISGGGEYLRALLVDQNVTRYVDPWHHHRPWHYYLRVVPLDFLPWSLLLPSALVVGWRRFTGRRREAFFFALAWAITTVVFFSLSPGKRTVYVLTMYPALALLVAAFVDELAARRPQGRAWIAVPLGLFAGLLAAAALLLPSRLGEIEELALFEPWVGAAAVAVVAALALGALASLIVSLRGRPARAVMVLAASLAAVMVAAFVFVVPQGDRIKSARPLSEKLLGVLAPGDSYAFYPGLDPRFVFYTGRRAEVLESEDELREYLRRGERAWLLIERDDLAGLDALPPLIEVARDADPADGYLLLHPAPAASR